MFLVQMFTTDLYSVADFVLVTEGFYNILAKILLIFLILISREVLWLLHLKKI